MKQARVFPLILLLALGGQVYTQPLAMKGELRPAAAANSTLSARDPQMPAAPLTLEECYDLARQNYPLIRQKELINRTREYSVDNAAKGYLPQVSFSGQATYQSQTIAFPFNFPGASLPVYSKDQYKAVAEVDQTLYDGGAIARRKELSATEEKIQLQSLEADLYALKERINQLFFGILLIREQLKQNELQRIDVQSGIDRVQASLANGTAFRSSLDELKAELLRVGQARTELLSAERSYRKMLAVFIHRTLEENTDLEKPAPIIASTEIRRPELAVFDYRKRSFDVQEQQLKTAYRPKISAFVQGAYGRPTLNFVSNDFGFYALGGIRLNWSLSGLYTRKNDRRLLSLNRQNLDIQKETFLFNTNLTLTQQSEEGNKYQDLIEQDRQIVDLRSSVKNAASAQLANGVITPHDYITQVNAESQSRQSLILHEIQLLQSHYNIKTTSGN